jgi:nucleoside-diphosphate-sugar epimerase
MGWEPHVGFREGLEKTVSWIGRNLDLYQTERYTI